MRPLLFSFLLTFLAFFFLLAMLWVQLVAARGDFCEWGPPAAEWQASPGPAMRLSAAGIECRIPLGWLDGAARLFQRTERWIVPTGARFSVRAGLLLRDLAGQARRDRLQREFYQNAGMV